MYSSLKEEAPAVSWLPSTEDISFYHAHGWFRTPPVLSDQLLDEALHGLEEHWSGHRDQSLASGSGFGNWMPGDGTGTRNNEYLSLQNLRVKKLVCSSAIGAIAARLCGSDEIRLFDDQMVFKPLGQIQSAVGWHVDGDYWRTCTSQKMLTAWIPLHDCPEELGPCVMVDKSHLWSHLIATNILSFNGQDMNSLQEHVECLGFPFQVIPMNMKRGQMSFHHARTLHGSYPNVGSRPRIACAVHLQDGANRYQNAYKPDGTPIHLFNDLLCTRTDAGYPDYSDPAVFPVLWRRDAGVEGSANV